MQFENLTNARPQSLGCVITRRVGGGSCLSGAIVCLLATLAWGCSDADVPDVIPGETSRDLSAHAEDLELQSAEDARVQDLQLKADAMGWTMEQAEADLVATEVIGELAEEVAKSRPDIFVGSALSKTPGEPPILYIKGPAPAAVKELAGKAAIAVVIEDGQPFSFDELVERQMSVNETLTRMGFDDVEISFDIQQRGALTANVSRKSELSANPLALSRALPAAVRGQTVVNVTEGPIGQEQFSIFGGMRTHNGIEECTTGWSMQQLQFGTWQPAWVTTAGHCPNNLTTIQHPGSGNHTASFSNIESNAFWGDVQLNFSTVTPQPRFFIAPTTTRLTLQVESAANITINEQVCVFSRLQSVERCSTISAFPVVCNSNSKLVKMVGGITIGGDSGASWYRGNIAFGGHEGLCGQGSTFSVADYFDEALNTNTRVYRDGF